MESPTKLTIKALFARSQNKCAFPGCSAPIVEESNTVTGEICHIKAASPLGPRYDPSQTEKDRHSVQNLILCCGRHHKIIDSELQKYTVEKLTEMKQQREQGGMAAVNDLTDNVANQLLHNFANFIIHSNSGQIAIQSPGAIQANTVNLKTTKSKVILGPPPGSIANNRLMLSYGKYLIERYQQFQKADDSKSGKLKYMLIYNALKRHFKGQWNLLEESRFNEVSTFLQNRIDNTKMGRINKSRCVSNYHLFADHK